MTDAPAVMYYYPNKMGRIILTAMEEILGRNGINAVLNLAELSHFIHAYPPNNLDPQFKFTDLGGIQTALVNMYGPRGGNGVALRTGRACFKHGLREFGALLGVTDLAFRLLPLNQKLSAGAAFFAEIFNRFSDQLVRIEETEDHIYWHIDRCPVCWGRHSDRPSCQLAVGILQESLYWVSGGRYFSVEEKRCIAQGDPDCTIEIDKKPVD